MINIIDLTLGVLILFYFVGHSGGVLKTLKNIIVLLLALMVFGVFAQSLINLSFAKPIHPQLYDSYLIRASYVLIKWSYPLIEKGAPEVDKFIKQKILASPAPEVTLPKTQLLEKNLPKLILPELPKLE